MRCSTDGRQLSCSRFQQSSLAPEMPHQQEQDIALKGCQIPRFCQSFQPRSPSRVTACAQGWGQWPYCLPVRFLVQSSRLVYVRQSARRSRGDMVAAKDVVTYQPGK